MVPIMQVMSDILEHVQTEDKPKLQTLEYPHSRQLLIYLMIYICAD